MEKKLNEEEVKIAINEAQAKMRYENNLFKSRRKIALTWNIIFFICIISISAFVSIITTIEIDIFNLKELFTSNSKDGLIVIIAFIISFLVGIFGAYNKTKALESATNFKMQEFLKEVYLNRLDKSQLNPKR